MFLIVGLGNPGDEYKNTRHNVGRIMVNDLAERFGFPSWNKSSSAKALYTNGNLGEKNVEMMLPETFMNESGFSVRYAVTKHDISPENVIVVYDDIDLPYGEIKVSKGRGDGGHNGIASIAQAIKTKDFARIRVGIRHVGLFGIAKRPGGEKLPKYVLANFKSGELKKLPALTDKVDTALKFIIEQGIEKAMQECNA